MIAQFSPVEEARLAFLTSINRLLKAADKAKEDQERLSDLLEKGKKTEEQEK